MHGHVSQETRKQATEAKTYKARIPKHCQFPKQPTCSEMCFCLSVLIYSSFVAVDKSNPQPPVPRHLPRITLCKFATFEVSLVLRDKPAKSVKSQLASRREELHCRVVCTSKCSDTAGSQTSIQVHPRKLSRAETATKLAHNMIRG